MGHVPSGALRQEGEGDDLPRRQHRRARADHRDLTSQPDLILTKPRGSRAVGRWGESIAEMVLVDHGAEIIGRNIVVGRGEIDLHVRFGPTVVVVEVKTLIVDHHMGSGPLRSFTSSKAEQVRRLARRLRPRPQRIDVVAVVAHRDGVDVRWVRGA